MIIELTVGQIMSIIAGIFFIIGGLMYVYIKHDNYALKDEDKIAIGCFLLIGIIFLLIGINDHFKLLEFKVK